MNVPVVTTLPTGDPDTIPMRPLERTAVLAGPPRKRPATAWDRSMKNFPPPDAAGELVIQIGGTLTTQQTANLYTDGTYTGTYSLVVAY